MKIKLTYLLEEEQQAAASMAALPGVGGRYYIKRKAVLLCNK